MRDSLTNLAAPPLFYEELRREIAKKSRSGEGLQVLRIQLNEIQVSQGVPKDNSPINFEKNSDFNSATMPDFEHDREILKFAQILSSSTRGDDVCARMGQKEFLVLFSGGALDIKIFITRIVTQWSKRKRNHILVSSSLLACSKESPLDFLNRLDLERLTEHSL